MEMRIYIDRIRDGQTEIIEGDFPTASFLPKEPELSFSDTLHLEGEAYLAGEHLVLQLTAHVEAFIPCSICNEPTSVKIVLSDLYHTWPLEEISHQVLDFSSYVREELLLELPKFAECQGNCPERANIKKYLHTNHVTDTHTPFSSLEAPSE